MRKEIEFEKFINLIKKVLDNLTSNDPAVRLNGIKLLEIISEDQPRPFQSVLFVLFSIIQVYIEPSVFNEFVILSTFRTSCKTQVECCETPH